MRAVFPNERLMLKEHFRCVEPIVRFSMQFYREKMIPLRVREAHERLDPPLIDIYVSSRGLVGGFGAVSRPASTEILRVS